MIVTKMVLASAQFVSLSLKYPRWLAAMAPMISQMMTSTDPMRTATST
jgi:hypothetical protein